VRARWRCYALNELIYSGRVLHKRADGVYVIDDLKGGARRMRAKPLADRVIYGAVRERPQNHQ
jgi:hypothetical protein